MQDYRKLQVWQRAHQLALKTYEVPAYLLKPEAWPLRHQILRAAISIPSNIAEGAGHGSNPDFLRFLWNSMGSCNELESQLLLAARGESPAAFGRRRIPPGCVAPPSNIPDILGRRALPAGRRAGLGATPDFHHGLLARMRELRRARDQL